MTFLKTFSKSEEFSTFNANHQEFATALIKIFNAAKDLDELISIALYCRDEVNVQLFVYAYYLVVSHRFVNIVLPNAFEIIPQCFVKKAIFEQLKEACHAQENKKPVNFLFFLIFFHTIIIFSNLVPLETDCSEISHRECDQSRRAFELLA